METKLNNISIYNERMDKSIEDKLWFNNMVDADVYVDFGCANGNLLKHLSYIHQKQGKTDIQYIGYDNNDEMLKIARQNCNRFKNISFTNDFVNIRNDYDISNDKKVCLILSSVLHEVYSYSKDLKEKKDFWESIFNLDFDYIAIRDMTSGINTDLFIPNINRIIEYQIITVKEKANKQQLLDFQRYWGRISSLHGLTHFLLKYKYLENWDREVKENYLPLTLYLLKYRLNFSYEIKYEKRYCLPYLKDLFKKDFDIDFIGYTHYNLLLELKEIK